MMSNRRNAIWLLINVLLILGLATGKSVFFNLAYLFGGLIVLSLLWSWLAVRGIRIGRRTRSRRSQVGRTFSETFSVRNAFFLPKLWLEVRDHSDLPGHRASHVVPPLLPSKHYEWRVDTQCIARGEFELGPMTIISGDPFGLFMTPRKIDASERMIVYPRTVPITQFTMPRGVMSGGEPQRYITQNITTNAAGVRDYVPGDSINRVHWKSTARRGALIVKEFEIDPLMDIWVLVDFSAESLVEDPSVQRFENTGPIIPRGGGIPPSTEEYAVIVASSLTHYFIEKERSLGFVAYTPERHFYQPERGHRQHTQILEALATARNQSERSLRDMLTLEGSSLTRGATVIVITSTLDESWIAEVNVLARRGIRPMCVYVDPTTFGASSSDEVRGRLNLMKVPTVVVSRGDDLTVALAQHPF
ncbi:MAG: DUF58 domain-containing protein [Chloroflexota bacterium]